MLVSGGDDLVLPFATERSRVGGRLARLGESVDTILARHDDPPVVGQALGEALALTALLGNMLNAGGKLIVQTKTDGPLHMLVGDYEAPGRVRGYAGYDAARLAALGAEGEISPGALLGRGHLALTIDLGGAKPRRQGIVALAGHTVAEAALAYFRESEQLPTFIRLAVARHYATGMGSTKGTWGWRAGGLMVQHTATAGGQSQLEAGAHGADLDDEGGDDWRRVQALAATVEDHELLDPTLAPERLITRLFHQEGVRTGAPTPLAARCRCSRGRVEALLASFGGAELADLREPDGTMTVTCEFCSATYRLAAEEVASRAP